MVLGLLVAVTACSSDTSNTNGKPDATAAASDTASPASAPPKQPAQDCGGGSGPLTQTFWLSGAQGTQLRAATVGAGSDVAVFVHESGTKGLCGFWPYAIWLAQRWHLRALLFDQCGYGGSTCAKDVRTEHDDWITSTQAAVTWARGHGARRVTLIGASLGGIVVLHAAASIRPAVDAVVNLSGELTWSGLDSLPAARTLTVPILYAVAPDDQYVTVADMRLIYAATPSRNKRLVQAPSGHGWDMLTPPSRSGWSPLATQVAEFIQGRHS
jgi:pimeloyl-ACP methyl ester carboxylesterase